MSYRQNNYNKSSKRQDFRRQSDNSWNNDNNHYVNNMPSVGSSFHPHHGFNPNCPPNAPFPPGFPYNSGYFNNQQSYYPQYNSNSNYPPNYGPPFQPTPMLNQSFNIENPSVNRLSNNYWTNDNWRKNDSDTSKLNKSVSNSNRPKNNWKKGNSNTLKPNNTVSYSNWTKSNYDTSEPNNTVSNSNWTKDYSDTLKPNNTVSYSNWEKSNSDTSEPNNTVSNSNWTKDNWKNGDSDILDSNDKVSNWMKDNSDTLKPNNTVSNSDWTKFNWQKGSNTNDNGESNCDNGEEIKRKVQRRWERSSELNTEGFLKPVVADKAERMMQLMGWQGGALGAKGDGITEPIMPHLNQAKGAGLGLKTPENQNKVVKLVKKTHEGFLKPVVADKAEKMMQLMGWQGGALGAKGDGIIEPIMPHLNQSKGAGLGLKKTKKPPKQCQPKKKKPATQIEPTELILKPPKRFATRNTKPQDPLRVPKRKILKHKPKEGCIELLYDILEFVRDRKRAIMIFDASLNKKQRLQVHQAINYVMKESEVLVLYDQFEIEVLEEIIGCNCYHLSTESFGKHPNRKLHLYKEAPNHMYLITKDDLNDDYHNDNDDDVKIIEHDNDIVVIDDDDDGSQGIVEIDEKPNELQENCIKIEEDDSNSINSSTTEEVLKVEYSNNVIESENEENKSNLEDLVDKVENNEISEVQNNCIENDSLSIKEEEENNPRNIKEEPNNAIEKNKLINIEKEPILKEETNLTNTNVVETKTIQQNNEIKEIEKNNSTKNKEILRKSLNSYLVEFFNDDEFTELRFLGDFEEWELNIIDEFILNLDYCILNPMFAENVDDEGFKEIFLSDTKLAIENGFDGGVVISKVLESNTAPDPMKDE